MKKIVLTFGGIASFCVASASLYMRVGQTDKMIDDYDVDDVQEVTFSDDASTMYVKLYDGTVKSYNENEIEAIYVDSSIYGGYDYVDLGLSVMWATCNVGSSSPNVMGTAFSWGEVSEKSGYSNLNYEWCVGDYLDYKLTKYCKSSCSGYNRYVDNLQTLLPEDDAATVNMGGYWRTPSEFEWSELLGECEWKWEGNGYTVTGKNGNSIFIPDGFYWTSDGGCNDAWIYQITPDFYNKSFNLRYEGNVVRPVIGRQYNRPIYNVSFYKRDSTLIKTLRVQHGQSVDANSVTTPFVRGSVFAGWGDASFDSVTSDMDVYATHKELQTPEYVDLGLSVKWASFNLGATAAEQQGDRYSWGNVSPENASFSVNYRVNSGTEYGVDYNAPTILLSYDDAATYNLGSDWRMPTYDEWAELKKNCEWTSYRLNDIDGFKVTAANGNWIFIPKGEYWSSELYPMSKKEASKIIATGRYPEMYYSYCSISLLVRPVYNK